MCESEMLQSLKETGGKHGGRNGGRMVHLKKNRDI